MRDTPDDPMRTGDEDFRTPSQMMGRVFSDFDCIFSGRDFGRETDADKAARDAYWERARLRRMEWDESAREESK